MICVLNCVLFLMSKKKEPKGEGGIREESEKETSEIKREEGRWKDQRKEEVKWGGHK